MSYTICRVRYEALWWASVPMVMYLQKEEEEEFISQQSHYEKADSR
jgi:hypothetical protein